MRIGTTILVSNSVYTRGFVLEPAVQITLIAVLIEYSTVQYSTCGYLIFGGLKDKLMIEKLVLVNIVYVKTRTNTIEFI